MQHYNPSIGEDLHRIFNLKGQSPSNEVSDEIVPVIVINSRLQTRSNSLFNGSTVTILTTPTDKDLYVVGLQLSIIKDATNTGVSMSINGTQEGVLQRLLSIVGISLTPQSESVSLSLPQPIKLDRGTNITLTSDSGVANIRLVGVVHYYTSETIKGV